MINYIRADLHRLKKRIPRWIGLAVFFLIWFRFFQTLLKGGSAYDMSGNFANFMNFFLPVIGLIELIFVYGDDFKAKTMQIGIGHGIKRRHIILAKALEYLIVSTVDLILMLVLVLVAGKTSGITAGGPVIKDMVLVMVFSLLKLWAALEGTMIMMFFFQSNGLANILFIVIITGVFGMIFNFIQGLKMFKGIKFTGFLLFKLINVVKSRALAGSLAIPELLGVIAWLAVLYVVCWLLFRKRELEF